MQFRPVGHVESLKRTGSYRDASRGRPRAYFAPQCEETKNKPSGQVSKRIGWCCIEGGYKTNKRFFSFEVSWRELLAITSEGMEE